MNVLSIKTGDSQYSELQFRDLEKFFKDQKDLRKKNFEIRLALKYTLNMSSVSSLIDSESKSENDSEDVKLYFLNSKSYFLIV